jgi:hypothetical protein
VLPREVRVKKGALCLLMALAVGTAACSKDSESGSKAPGSSAATGASLAPTSAAPETGPVTDADVAEVDQILHRLDNEIDRLDSDLATGEGEVQ